MLLKKKLTAVLTFRKAQLKVTASEVRSTTNRVTMYALR